MSIEAEIDATVSAFVTDLMELVRRTALESVQEALSELEVPPTSRPAHVTRPARAPARAPAPPESTRTRPPVPAPSKGPRSQRSSTPPGSVRPLPVLAKAQPGAGAQAVPARPVPPVPPVVVRRLPPKRRRVARAAPPPPPPPTPVEAAEPQPAKRWVVVRRPARDRAEPPLIEAGGAAAAATPLAKESAPPATPVNGASAPLEQAPATTKVPSSVQ